MAGSALVIQALGALGATAASAEEGSVKTDVLGTLVGQSAFGQTVEQALRQRTALQNIGAGLCGDQHGVFLVSTGPTGRTDVSSNVAPHRAVDTCRQKFF
jgi:hypothetical protein